MEETTTGRSLAERLPEALRLQADVFEEVEHDPEAITQAAVVVGLAGMARGFGAIWDEGLAAMAAGVVGGFVLWVGCTAVIWWVGVRSFGASSDFRQLLRTLGFASAPLLWLAIGLVPWSPLQLVVWTLAHALALIAFQTAVRQALDLTQEQSLWVCVLALVVGLLLLFMLGILFVGAPAAAP